ncbi:MAG: methylenetetrahydrofolate reductase [Desulfovibrionaceae bacterium]|nr:methylenetetrahydrofolate reductase [Desulfovibrionaceae bacterium]
MKISELLAASARPFYSLEFFPPREEAQLPDFFAAAAKLSALNPLFASVTYGAGGGRQADTLEISRALKERLGFEPMPHLTCVGSRREGLAAFLERLRALGIDNVLALRGDAPKAARPEDPPYDWSGDDFQHASNLVAFIRERFSDFCIGVAAYPQPHPESSSRELDRFYTMKKLSAGGDFLITQLFFELREYLDFVAELRALGLDKPVLPGVFPVQSLESLRYVTGLCGVSVPVDFQRELEEAQARGGQVAVRELGARRAAAQTRELIAAGAPGVHLYTLNKADLCLKIAELAGI